jgi:hypothetical protein
MNDITVSDMLFYQHSRSVRRDNMGTMRWNPC